MSDLNGVVEQIARIGAEMTGAIDRGFGGGWSENEEILALLEIILSGGTTTRRIAEVSGLNRRTVSRLVARLSADGLIAVGTSPADRRVITVRLSPVGIEAAERLRVEATDFIIASRSAAAGVVDELTPGRPHTLEPDRSADPLQLLQRIARVGVLLVDRIEGRAGRAHLSGRQRTALIQIGGRPGIRPSTLHPALGLSPSGITYVVGQLSAVGLIRREPGAIPGDRRAIVLEVTPEGDECIRLIIAAIDAVRTPLAEVLCDVAAWPGTSLRPAALGPPG
ncbi:MarR family transcriptional regulator [Microbacteriaceae bacterium VKM Ac-2855]|nr:MarR family transcriptional regulator [Microbacteriaceae bacterium VKM Ac-2855]